MATCPECDADIELDEFDVDVGDAVSCDECGTNLVVIKMSPLDVDVADDDDSDDASEERALGDDDDGDEEPD